MGYIDLHTHTRRSDGALTTKEMLAKARAAGVTTLAISDHDVIESSLEAQASAGDMTIIPAVEIDTLMDGALFHVLAYHADFKNANLLELIADSRKKLDRMSDELIMLLSKRDARVKYEEYLSYHPDRLEGGWDALYYLRKKRVTQSLKAGIRLYADNGIGYETAGFAHAREAVRAIHASGGLAVIAHPGATYRSGTLNSVKRALAAGFDGIECHYPSHSSELTRELILLCRERGLYITSGSDDHGPFSGAGVGSLKTESLNFPMSR